MNAYFKRVAFERYALGLWIPVSVAWKLQHGLSLSAIALTEGLVLAVTLLAEFPAGWFADARSKKDSLVVGSVLHSLALCLALLAPNFSAFLVVAILQGLAWAFISGADEAHLHDDYTTSGTDYKKRLAKGFIIDETSTLIGMLSSSLLLFLSSSILVTLILATCSMLLSGIISFWRLPTSKDSAPKTELPIEINRTTLYTYGLLFICLGVLYENLRFLWSAKLQLGGVRVVDLGALLAMLKIASIIGSVGAHQIAYTFRRFILSAVFMSCLLLTFASNSVAVIVIGLFFLQLAENIFRTFQSVYLNSIIQRRRASILSLASIGRNASGSAIIFISGILANKSIKQTVLLVVSIKLLGILLFVVLAEARNQSQAKPPATM